MKQNALYWKEKEKRRFAVLYWKALVRIFKGNIIDQEVIEKWKQTAQINMQIEIIEGAIETNKE